MNNLSTYFKKPNGGDATSCATNSRPENKKWRWKKTYLLLFALFFISSFVSAQNEFITEWKTDNTGVSTDQQITIPAVGKFNYTWKLIGGATTGSGAGTGSTTITFPVAGNYELKITPIGPNAFSAFNFFNATSDARKLLKITQWGTTEWSTFQRAFSNTSNLAITATDVPDLGLVTDMSYAFSQSKIYTIPNVNNWNVGNVTDMTFAFAFTGFNDDIGNWNVKEVTTMKAMFYYNSYFNQDISRWDVSEVTNMENMFFQTFAFDQNLGSWNISKVTNAANMFKANMSCINYSKTLAGWAANDAHTPINITFGAPSLEYSPEVIGARDYLINDRGWNIVDDNESATACPIDFVTEWNTQGSNSIIIPAVGEYTYSWIDLNDASRKGKGKGLGFTNIDFGQAGTYEVRIFPFGRDEFYVRTDNAPSADQKKLTKIKQWGAHRWTYLNYAFEDAENLKITATDIPDLRKVTSMDRTFFKTGISSVPNINLWDVSEVTNMYNLFGRTNFNDNISDWDVSSVENTAEMFLHAIAFNQDLSDWDLTNVKNMSWMFGYANNFDQNLGKWKLNSAVEINNMFVSSGIGCVNYSKTLKGWANNNDIKQGLTFGAHGREYSPDVTADRNFLINNKGWNITGDSQGTCSLGALNADLSNLKVFPNPVTDFLTVNGLEGRETLSLYDMSGRLMQSSKANGKEVKLNLSLYAKGMYLLNITSDKGTRSKKIIKQ